MYCSCEIYDIILFDTLAKYCTKVECRVQEQYVDAITSQFIHVIPSSFVHCFIEANK